MMSKPRLNHWIVVSQVTLLVLVGALAWQGISAARTQDRMVRTLLGDYAQLIAENAERTFNVALGYRTLYALIQGLQSQPELFPTDNEWQASAFSDSTDLAVSVNEILTVAVRNRGTGEIRVLWRHQDFDSDAVISILSPAPVPTGTRPVQFQVQHPELEGVTQTLVVAAIPGADEDAVIWLDPALIVSRVRTQMETATLLPPALGDPERLRPNINLSLSDASGRTIFSTPYPPNNSLARSHIINGDYSGLMAGFELRASINPAIAGELVIGGLPYGRLPFIFGLVIIALVLGVLGFFMLRRQRDVQRLRDDFVARVSHELRTPLTQIRMYAESLLYKRINKPEARSDALAVINREALRLGNMVDSILRFEDPRTTAAATEPEPYLLARWAENLNSEFQPLLNAEDAKLVILIPDHVTTSHNRDALTQIAGNLLDNALKYGPSGQQIRLAYCETDDGFQLGFKDQGPGIPHARRESVFEPYRRLGRDRDSGSTGTGIGLSVARDIAVSMGGSLNFEGDSSEGEFVLTLQSEGNGTVERANG